MTDQCCIIFKSLGDPTRLKILQMLSKKEMCVSDIAKEFRMTQPSVSHHLDQLKRAGLVRTEKRGREVYYSFDNKVLVECCGKELRVMDLMLKRVTIVNGNCP